MQGKTYLCVPIADVIESDILSWFSTCNDFIHVARRNKGSVLVHWYQLQFSWRWENYVNRVLERVLDYFFLIAE